MKQHQQEHKHKKMQPVLNALCNTTKNEWPEHVGEMLRVINSSADTNTGECAFERLGQRVGYQKWCDEFGNDLSLGPPWSTVQVGDRRSTAANIANQVTQRVGPIFTAHEYISTTTLRTDCSGPHTPVLKRGDHDELQGFQC